MQPEDKRADERTSDNATCSLEGRGVCAGVLCVNDVIPESAGPRRTRFSRRFPSSLCLRQSSVRRYVVLASSGGDPFSGDNCGSRCTVDLTGGGFATLEIVVQEVGLGEIGDENDKIDDFVVCLEEEPRKVTFVSSCESLTFRKRLNRDIF